jgi:branched-chain amino acid transport system ATP-binding protein
VLVHLIFDTIKKVNAENGTTIFLVEQNANMALSIANRGYVMETGQITLEGPSEELLNNDRIKAAYLGL